MYIESLDSLLEEGNSGAKAFHLSKMKRAGFPVPPGFVIKVTAFEHFFIHQHEIDEKFRREISSALSSISAINYMVRSSAIGEDGIVSSFAGQLASYQSSNSIDEIISKVFLCWESYQNEQVSIYQATSGTHLAGMAVVVQEMIAPNFAGVIFSRHPFDERNMLIEYVEGHGEQLVSGDVHPTSIDYCRGTGNFSKQLPFQLEVGIHLVEKLEQFYSYSLDIEWAIRDEVFYVLQARPITTSAKSKRIYWSNTNVNENYPDAITPLLYSIARDSYYHYFKNLSKLFLIPTDRVRAMEPAYSNVIAVHGCKMYYNMSSLHEIISASPFSEMLLKSFDNFVGYTKEQKVERKNERGNKIGFIKEAYRFNASLEETVKDFEKRVDNYQEASEKAITFEEIKQQFHDFIEIRMHSWYKASLADFFAMLYHGLLGKFCAKYYSENADGIHNQLIQAIPGLISSEPIVLMYKINLEIRKNIQVYNQFKKLDSGRCWEWIHATKEAEPVRNLIVQYLNQFGFRCSGELMLTSTNYAEDPSKFIDLLKQYDQLPESNPEEIIARKSEERLQIIRRFKREIWKKNGVNIFKSISHHLFFSILIRLAAKGISARERVRLKQASLYFQFKKIITKCGCEFQKRKLLQEGNDILYLRYTEIIELLNSSTMLPESVQDQVTNIKKFFKEKSKLIYPDDFYSHLGEFPLPDEIPVKTVNSNASLLKGLCACGGKIQARVKVLDSVMEAHKLEKGDILVTRQTDPGWVVVFPLISGLIVERGGMLSHGAIVSREFGIPAIVGVEGASTKLKDGDIVILNAFTGEINIVNE